MRNSALCIASQIMVMAIIISVVLLFAGIGVLVLIHVCVVGRAFRRGLISANRVERGSQRSIGMSADDLEMLPCFDFKDREKGASPVDCAVCLDNFKMGDKCRLLPNCKHSFHAQCVDSWLLKAPFCPICRTAAGTQKSIGEEVIRSSGAEFELRESPLAAVAIPVSSNPSPLHTSSLE
ncbi:E3 ubiquitin-protein ligase RNF13-like protein [Cinnamomum micranthum f. kanehirae]|uniref:E3 ubiquitin-protein ligase RNF13-like protein n=1 Tax=Cinnamomum micranthum f. kanehirae TaxID=337451 RepID=A0A443NEZ8_9MAGN|nr:E3 ubiquitin-protein ligase RNF13-like protein [Cinnamomum micranthum f. kanehirae]